MANATYAGGVPVNYGTCTLYLDIYETTDEANNRSLIRGVLTLAHSGSGSPFNSNASSWSMNLGGNVFSGSGGYNLPGDSSMTLLDNSVYIGHNANGSGSVSVSGSFSGNGGFPIGSGSASGTYTMVDFDRKPAAPTTVSIALNADKSITVTSNAVSSPAGTATYYISSRSSSNGGSTWGSWSSYTTIPSNARTYTYSAGSLTYGLTYQFRMYASNSDGSSAATTSNSPSTVFLPAGGKRFDGSTWNPTGTAKRFDGTNWNTLTVAKRFNGTSWVDMT